MTSRTLRLPKKLPKQVMTKNEEEQFLKVVQNYSKSNTELNRLNKTVKSLREHIVNTLESKDIVQYNFKNSCVSISKETRTKVDKAQLIIDGLLEKYETTYTFNKIKLGGE